MIRYSIVIPTKSRPNTLKHVLSNVLSSKRTDIEVIVHQCGICVETNAVITSIIDTRLRYYFSIDSVSMRENWESALNYAIGDFITVIGDDDGIIPGAFEIADDIIRKNALSILTWRPVTYYWPGYFNKKMAGRAFFHYDIKIGNIRFSTKHALRCLYQFRWHYSEMPMIYNSFVSRKLIERIRKKYGQYFFFNSPDVISGVMNSLNCTDFLWSNYPLTITGISENSTGHRTVMQTDVAKKNDALLAFKPEKIIQSWVQSATNIDFNIAVELMKLHEMIADQFDINPPSMLDLAEYVAGQIYKYPNIKESLNELQNFCLCHNLDYNKIQSNYFFNHINSDYFPNEISTVDQLVMNRNLSDTGDQNISAAAESIAAYLGAPRATHCSSVGFELSSLRLSRGAVNFEFSRSGNAPQYLDDGWNSSEEFGTWGSRYESVVTLPPLDINHPDGQLHFEISGRGPILSDNIYFFYTVSIEGTRRTVSSAFSAQRLSGVDKINLNTSELIRMQPLRLIFHCFSLVNPALLNISRDNRALGFGLTSIKIDYSPKSDHLTIQ